MKLGIVGLPNVGKSTLFNAIMQTGAQVSDYPFSTVSPNIGKVPVPDKRLDRLREIYNPKVVTPASVELVDIAGLVKGSSRGEGLGNQFLSHIREADALIHVVRCFTNSMGEPCSPVSDVETINLELILSDLEMIERRFIKTQKTARVDKSFQREADILEKIIKTLESGQSARSINWSDQEDIKLVESLSLITQKPVLYAANISEEYIKNPSEVISDLQELAKSEDSQIFISCAKFESEIAMLDEEERAIFLEDAGVNENGLARLIIAGYSLLGLISFLTGGPKEVRAWTIKKGLKAPEAAGKIHSDLERGFIRAEVVAYTDLDAAGSYNVAKEKGHVRIEGKEYIVKDGDVMLIRFNV